MFGVADAYHSERASSNKLPMSLLQSREVRISEAGQESGHWRALLQGLRAAIPDRH